MRVHADEMYPHQLHPRVEVLVCIIFPDTRISKALGCSLWQTVFVLTNISTHVETPMWKYLGILRSGNVKCSASASRRQYVSEWRR